MEKKLIISLTVQRILYEASQEPLTTTEPSLVLMTRPSGATEEIVISGLSNDSTFKFFISADPDPSDTVCEGNTSTSFCN